MRAEATVVRVEALQASGDTARATALGQRFLAKNPKSPYADYVKRILAQTH
jgi:outer membrane protein assembly factor BamD (BamD/ComL family)